MLTKRRSPVKIKLSAMLVVFLAVIAAFVLPTVAEARSNYFSNYKVNITVNKDSTVDIEERITNRFEGEFQGVIADIPLNDPARLRECRANNLRCGGFEWIYLLGVYDNQGRELSPNMYTAGVVTEEDSEVSYYQIKWLVWPGGKVHNGLEDFTWTIKYRVFGSLIEEDGFSTLYWNAIPTGSGTRADNVEVNISFPEGVITRSSDLQIYLNRPNPSVVASFSGNRVIIAGRNILPEQGDLTVEYRVSDKFVDKAAKLTYTTITPWADPDLIIAGQNFGNVSREFNGLPTGKYQITFARAGYEPASFNVDVSPGELINLEVVLEPEQVTVGLIIINLICIGLGLILTPIAAWIAYRRWLIHGRDEDMPATFIPQFSPPEGMHPYLLGSLKDEKVDDVDITGTIIDLAYRGFIKIKQIDKKNYELTRLRKDEEAAQLDTIETEIMKMLFGEGVSLNTKDLKPGPTLSGAAARFHKSYKTLKETIYKQMMELRYFRSHPEHTRQKYFGFGIAMLILGFVTTVVFFAVGWEIIGYPGPITLGLAVSAGGMVLMAIAQHMPAKTALGSKAYADVMGFRMYMHHAERYRVQNLKPEDFEKYLSYAVVFGIEKDWAKQFEGIYKANPEWLETYDGSLMDVYWMSRFTSNFKSTMNTTVISAQPSGKGGGSFGGGGFGGGFSGGGGGGGGRGGF